MVKVSVVIKTNDRGPRRNYLDETRENLKRAGVFDSEHLAYLLIQDGAGRTLHQNAAKCVELAATGPCDYAMVLEDDLDFCDSFLENVTTWLEDHVVSAPQMYVLGANYEQIGRVAEHGGAAWAYPVGAFYGAQALVWRRQDAAQLAEWLGPDPSYNGVTDHGHDLLLQSWGKEQELTHFIASAPCMVQHIGEESGINNRFFQFPWGGRSWKYERRAA